MCIQLLLVSGLLSVFGFPFLSPREFSGFKPHDHGLAPHVNQYKMSHCARHDGASRARSI